MLTNLLRWKSRGQGLSQGLTSESAKWGVHIYEKHEEYRLLHIFAYFFLYILADILCIFFTLSPDIYIYLQKNLHIFTYLPT